MVSKTSLDLGDASIRALYSLILAASPLGRPGLPRPPGEFLANSALEGEPCSCLRRLISAFRFFTYSLVNFLTGYLSNPPSLSYIHNMDSTTPTLL